MMLRTLAIALISAAPLAVSANDFPTQARVEFVLGCMNEQGGQNYDTLYSCVCLVDRIAAEMPYLEFAEAQVFAQLRSTAGERGSMFRDPERASLLTGKLEAARSGGEAACFVNEGAGRDERVRTRRDEGVESESARTDESPRDREDGRRARERPAAPAEERRGG